MRFILLFLVAMGGLCLQAAAHNKSVSYSEWQTIDDGIWVATVRVPARQATLLLADGSETDAATATRRHFETALSVSVGDTACARMGPAASMAGAADMVLFAMRFRCGETGAPTLRSDAFFALAAGHMHFVRVSEGAGSGEGSILAEAVLTTHDRSVALGGVGHGADGAEMGSAVAPLHSVLRLLPVGFMHILTGPDHLVFLLGLVLVSRGRRALLWAITGFTVGHSLALAASVTGLVSTASVPVEAVIAFTIWLVGVHALAELKTRSAMRTGVPIAAGATLGLGCLASLVLGVGPALVVWFGLALLAVGYLGLCCRPLANDAPSASVSLLLTATLGLAHGFGFAGGLAEAFSGAGSLSWALAAFNIGVELGQVAFVSLLLVSLWAGLAGLDWLVRSAAWETGPVARMRLALPAQTAAALAIIMAGAFWFTERALMGGWV